MPTDRPFLDGLIRRPIAPDVDVTGFKCKPEIEWFLQNVAHEHHDRRMSVATCWMHESVIAGYITTSMGLAEHDDQTWRDMLGLGAIRFFAAQKPRKKFPAIVIGMLGVDERFRRKGLGTHMLRHAVVTALDAADTVGCRVVYVDSDKTYDAIGLYKSAGFAEVPHPDAKRTTSWMYFDLKSRSATASISAET
jgi:ribosomal protein S18 acetylase RimI-like enzyme